MMSIFDIFDVMLVGSKKIGSIMILVIVEEVYSDNFMIIE